MTAARRLSAILAADIAGYSRPMGEDEAGTAKIVRERRETAALDGAAVRRAACRWSFGRGAQRW